MCETGHSDAGGEMRRALQRLEEALVRHAASLAESTARDPADPSLQALRRSVALMREEAQLLRARLAADD